MREEEVKTISIAKDFSRFPAGRFCIDGKASGEAFRKKHLVPALNSYREVVVDFDGVAGFGSSFLEESFGGLMRAERFDSDHLEKHLKLFTTESDLEDYTKLAWRYIRDAASPPQR